jgi:hypothetical protein
MGVNIKIMASISACELGNFWAEQEEPRPMGPREEHLPKRDPSRALAPPQIIESTKPKTIVARAKTVAQLSSNKREHKFRKP